MIHFDHYSCLFTDFFRTLSVIFAVIFGKKEVYQKAFIVLQTKSSYTDQSGLVS